ncbi:DNA-binding transcriptional regulator OxyR [Rhodothermaceae bacterium RA]|nr:DNA-binding transcriptional regulator OxyR [Rhodothermaceae bacterium RA]
MTLTQLAYVVAVDTFRHFGRAAAHCCVSQPTLSMQLQKLEEELGVRLFDRSRKPVVPTDIGAQVVAQARVVLHEVDRIPDLIRQADDVVTGTLHLGVIPTLAPYVLPLVTGPFAERYPGVDIVVREWTTTHLLEHLATDQLDAALIASADAPAGVITQALFDEPFVAYVSPTHPLSARGRLLPDEVDVGELWLLQEGHCFRDQVLQLCGADAGRSCATPLRFESGNLETLRILVDRTGGMTLLPFLATLFLSDRERAHVRAFQAPAPHRTVRLAYGRAYLKRALINAFAGTVRSVIGPLLEQAEAPEAAGGEA